MYVFVNRPTNSPSLHSLATRILTTGLMNSIGDTGFTYVGSRVSRIHTAFALSSGTVKTGPAIKAGL